MYSYSPTLSYISLKKSLGKVFKYWSRDYFHETKIRFLAPILNRSIFLLLLLLIYGCVRCIQIWCKFCTEIPTGKYLQMVGSKWTPLCTNGSEK